jgi:hypothetical protein
MELIATPPANSLLALDESITFEVQGIDLAATGRLFQIGDGTGWLYQYNDGVETIDPAVTAVVTITDTGIVVKLTWVASFTDGDLAEYSMAYEDSLADPLLEESAYAYGTITLLLQTPAPGAGDVSPITDILLTGTFSPVISNFSLGATINGWRVERPDFASSLTVFGTSFTYSTQCRRLYPDDSVVPVVLTFEGEVGGDVYARTLRYWFHVAKRVTPQVSTLAVSRLDRAYGTTLFETLRQAFQAGIRPERSSAPLAVLAFYAVQQSGLASLAGLLPRDLSDETEQLLPRDIASPLDVVAQLANVAMFWDALLESLLRVGAMDLSLLTTLHRSWLSQSPLDQVAAIAWVLLYGEDRVA